MSEYRLTCRGFLFSIVQFSPIHHMYICIYVYNIGIDTKIGAIVVSPTTCEAHHRPRAKPEGCGQLPRSLVTPQWPKSRYQFLSYHDASKHIKSMQIRVCISRKSPIKLLQISHYGKHGHRLLSQQLPWLRLGNHCHSDACVIKSWQYASLKTSKSNKMFGWNI